MADTGGHTREGWNDGVNPLQGPDKTDRSQPKLPPYCTAYSNNGIVTGLTEVSVASGNWAMFAGAPDGTVPCLILL